MNNFYPEHIKLEAVSKISQEIGVFIDWLEEEDMEICYLGGDERFHPIGLPIEKLLARFFEIDLREIEAEKVQMIKRMRDINKQIQRGKK